MSDMSDESRRSVVTLNIHIHVISFFNPLRARLPLRDSFDGERCRDVHGEYEGSWIYAYLGMASPAMPTDL